jgi:LCP family protein required for cell wall assembly
MKSSKQRTPRSVDGFVPRRRGGVASSIGTRRRTLNDFESVRSKESVEFRTAETDSSDNNVVNIDPSELNTLNLKDKVAKKRRPGIFKPKKEEKKWKNLTKKQKRRRITLIVLLLIFLFGGFMGWKFLRNTGKIFDGNILGFFDNTKLKGEDQGRVNILLAGTSEGDPGHQGADLTDSIMIASLDTKNNTAFTVSIPRDTWVNYGMACSSGYAGKINVVYQCGNDNKFEESGYPDGGMGLLEKIISQNFGIPIHYYAKINYKAFEQAVKSVGGIDITLKTDSPYGIMDRIFDWECNYQCYKVKYPNGKLHLNGEQALDLARARGDYTGYPTYGTGGDFGRTNRQRDMLVALKDKILSANTLFNPAKISGLLDAAGNNVKTDFKTNELRRLYDLSKKYDNGKIKSIDLSSEDVNLVTTDMYQGQSIVLPVAGLNDFSQIKAYFKRLTSNDPVVREDAKVVVLNGSGVSGLAQKRADELTAKNLKVISVANGKERSNTIIVDKTKGTKPATASLLKKLLTASASTDTGQYADAANYKADFVVIIGAHNSSSGSQ